MLENLLKFANYSIQVLAFTGAGDGLYSLPIDCATHSDGELGTPLLPIMGSGWIDEFAGLSLGPRNPLL